MKETNSLSLWSRFMYLLNLHKAFSKSRPDWTGWLPSMTNSKLASKILSFFPGFIRNPLWKKMQLSIVLDSWNPETGDQMNSSHSERWNIQFSSISHTWQNACFQTKIKKIG